MHITTRAISVTLCLALILLFAFLQSCAYHPQSKPDESPRASTVFLNGKEYTGGLVVIKAIADTSALARKGFMHLSRPYGKDSSICLVAWWPQNLKTRALTKILTALYPYGLEREGDSIRVVQPNRKGRAFLYADKGDGTGYAHGYVIVRAKADTTLLKSLGFKGIQFFEVIEAGERYFAEWPADMPWDYIPPHIISLICPPPPRVFG